MKPLALFAWEKASDGSMLGIGPKTEATEYLAKVLPTSSTNGGWTAFLMLNAVIVFQGEYEGRNDAQLAAVDALRRAIRLREGKEGLDARR